MTSIKALTRFLFGGFFVVAGANHFVNTAFYVAIMPPYLPWHLELVYVSGVAEVGGSSLRLAPSAFNSRE